MGWENDRGEGWQSVYCFACRMCIAVAREIEVLSRASPDVEGNDGQWRCRTQLLQLTIDVACQKLSRLFLYDYSILER